MTDQSVKFGRSRHGHCPNQIRVVAYRESGSGPTVLLLHATLHDRHDFDPVIETLSRRYRTIAV
ncbi:alpha/beta fold hydrolase, partial [Mycobacterium szulgai]|uniref:alpha/beta fold hydrolase n=1 Tax=Mycobacterium szulgai TaxID=1787 RepID=UPI003555C2D8|nr:hypothetical protein [Mycobacterium szulgai]